MTLEEYICINKKEEIIERCENCGGLTNSCGLYANKLNEDIFDRYFREKEN